MQVSGLTLAGTASGNYTLTQPTTTADITPATPTVSVTDAGGTYSTDPYTAKDASVTGVGKDGKLASFGDPTLSYSYFSGATLLAGAPTAAGAYTVVAHYASDNPNYTDADSSPLSFTIGQAPIYGSFTAANKTYDGTTNATVTSTSLNPLEYVFTYNNDGTNAATGEIHELSNGTLWLPVEL